MKQCPNCNGYFSDEQLFCPECGLKLEDVRPEPESQPQEDSEHGTSQPAQRSSGLVIFLAILLAVAVIGIGKVYSELTYERDMREFDSQQMQSVRNELYAAQSELDKLSDLVGVYGYASEDFYAGKSVIVLEVGETQDIPIYMYGDVFDNPEQVYAWWDDLVSNQFSVAWESEWPESNCHSLEITGISPGYATIKLAFLDHLYDDLTDGERDVLLGTLATGDNVFEVLVIVTD